MGPRGPLIFRFFDWLDNVLIDCVFLIAYFNWLRICLIDYIFSDWLRMRLIGCVGFCLLEYVLICLILEKYFYAFLCSFFTNINKIKKRINSKIKIGAHGAPWAPWGQRFWMCLIVFYNFHKKNICIYTHSFMYLWWVFKYSYVWIKQLNQTDKKLGSVGLNF